jgi:predicted permease
MATFRPLASRLAGLFRRRELHARVDEELEFHIGMETQENIRRGMAPSDARVAARRAIGNTTQVCEEVHRMNTIEFLDETGRIIRQTLRAFRHRPGFAVTAIATLALGIGSSTAIFSVVNSVLIRPLPYPEADQLIVVRHTAELGSSPFLYFTEREQSRTLAAIGAYNTGNVTLTGSGEPEPIQTIFVTSDVLRVLGVRPLMGRYFSDADDRPGSMNTVVLTHAFWQRRFRADPGIVGRNLILDGQSWSVIGVMPAQFSFLDRKADVLMPIRLDRSLTTAGSFFLASIARMKSGVTLEQAAADINRLIPIAKESFPPMPGMTLEELRNAPLKANLKPLKNEIVGNVGNALWVLMGTIGIVMLIACGNVVNLILLRTEARAQELSIRAALGAQWRRIAGELLTESMVLSGIGGVVGISLAYTSLHFLISIAPATVPRVGEITLDTGALLFTLIASLFCGACCAAVPLLRYSKPKAAALRSGRALSDNRERIRVRGVLVVTQVALAVMLLIGSGLMIRTFRNMYAVDPGFSGIEELQTVQITVPFSLDPVQTVQRQQALLDRIVAIPGVTSAAFTSALPMGGAAFAMTDLLAPVGKLEGGRQPAEFRFVSPNYRETMRTRLVTGRDLTWTDVYQYRPVAMISENLAIAEWGSADAALGKHVRGSSSADQPREVIGVVADVRANGPSAPAARAVYVPMVAQRIFNMPLFVWHPMIYVIRSSRAGAESLTADIRRAVSEVDSSLPLADVRTMEQVVGTAVSRTSFTTVVISAAAAVALMLSLIGIYGVIAYTVARRNRETGIRIALGASPGSVSGMFLRQGIALSVAGTLIGLLAAAGASRWMSSLLFGVTPLDAGTYLTVALVLLIAAMVASYVPAHRAALADPAETLRRE